MAFGFCVGTGSSVAISRVLSAPDLIKIADLGVAIVLHSHHLERTQIGTPLYIAPEILRRPEVRHLVARRPPLRDDDLPLPLHCYFAAGLERRVCTGDSETRRGYSLELVSVLRLLLQVNPVA
jgi:serine/threonine protein kinase